MGTGRQEQQDGLCWGTAAAPGLSFALLVSHTHTHTVIKDRQTCFTPTLSEVCV